MKSLIQNKKGNLGMFLVMGIIFLFTFAMVLFIMHFFVNETITAFQSSKINDSAEARQTMAQGAATTGLLDLVVVLSFLAFIIGMIAYASLVPAHPIMIVAFIILLGLSILIAVPLSNGYEKLYDTGKMESTAAEFTMTNHIMDNLPAYVLIIGAIGIIVMFAKRKAVGYAGGIE